MKEHEKSKQQDSQKFGKVAHISDYYLKSRGGKTRLSVSEHTKLVSKPKNLSVKTRQSCITFPTFSCTVISDIRYR